MVHSHKLRTEVPVVLLTSHPLVRVQLGTRVSSLEEPHGRTQPILLRQGHGKVQLGTATTRGTPPRLALPLSKQDKKGGKKDMYTKPRAPLPQYH